MTYTVKAILPYKGDKAQVTNVFKDFKSAVKDFYRVCRNHDIKPDPIDKGTIWAKEENDTVIIELEKHSL